MSFFKVCPHCGAHLDPGESCDCRAKEEAPASSAKADEGGVEHVDHAVSTSTITENGGFVK